MYPSKVPMHIDVFSIGRVIRVSKGVDTETGVRFKSYQCHNWTWADEGILTRGFIVFWCFHPSVL